MGERRKFNLVECSVHDVGRRVGHPGGNVVPIGGECRHPVVAAAEHDVVGP
ncbi:hypothetical protein [Arthrobacter sp. CAL618]|uniref:hypothetical protein n=1 Tax=Arthrobacter sp. CAL618 TaxID=1055770 RepID=UPI003FCC69EF